MNPSEAAQRVARALNDAEVSFCFVGSFSSNRYGIPRSTKDVDLVVETPMQELAKLMEALGPEFLAGEQIRFETNTGTICQEIAVKGSAMKIELFMLSDDSHDRVRFARRVALPMFGTTVYFPTAEDVIVWKLRWARPKDLEDIRGVILVQSREATLDWAHIRRWCTEHGTLATLRALVESLPEVPAGWEEMPD